MRHLNFPRVPAKKVKSLSGPALRQSANNHNLYLMTFSIRFLSAPANFYSFQPARHTQDHPEWTPINKYIHICLMAARHESIDSF